MRVLHAISSINPAHGGPPVALAGLARAQAAAGLEVQVVATYVDQPGGPQAIAAFEEAGVKVTHIGPAKNPMSRHPDLARILDERISTVDVVHVHAMWESIQRLACVTARRRGIPYVVTPHGLLDRFNMSTGWFKKRTYFEFRMRGPLNGAAALHFATEMERGAVARLRLRAQSIVEPFGLAAGEYASLPAEGTFRSRNPQLAHRRYVMFLGRLDYGKGLELLIPAFAATRDREAQLVIAGPDSFSGYRRTVEALIDRHAVRERVILTGLLDSEQKRAALVDAHVLCHPSFHENFGLVVVEALACGCPVILSDQVYLHPQLSREGLAKVVRLDVGEVTAALESALTAPKADGEAGRNFVLDRFNWERIGRDWAGHYQGMIKG